MTYQISLSFDGSLISDQFESFGFNESVDVLLDVVIAQGGVKTIIHIPGDEKLTSLTLTRQVDDASLKFQSLFLAAAGKAVPPFRGAVALTFPATVGAGFVRYDFTNAFVSSIASSGNRHGGAGPEEQIQIAFDSVTLSLSAPNKT